MNRVLVAMLPWLWILIGVLNGLSAALDFGHGRWLWGSMLSVACIVAILLGLAERAKQRLAKPAVQPEVHP